ncbi:ADP-ribosylation factor-like 6 interacting protein 1 isoform X2 [Leptinotarsa decemlineata]|uniref:ADP-ribosylation factor-like 6 interacting protein 1 isoform X2 n=1 Tax=Leptinotarsa decemlineata TaxID=7539 RepID=UPI000C252916|nr:ADP-ribosylation factor-like protein 6-interacting protein 1 isoform X2 [Leptinotarsa decemlineata]
MSETESQIRKLRLSMEAYRELMLHGNSILLWEKQWHSSAIIGGCTVIFMLIWLSDPNILTILSLLGMLITLADYTLPMIISSIFKEDTWNNGKQKQYEDICTNIILYKTKFELLLDSYYRMRVTNPKMYFGLTIIGLGFLAWIGGTVNNLFLTYVFVLLLLLLPGMAYNGFLNKGLETLSKIFTDLVENAKSKVVQKKTE